MYCAITTIPIPTFFGIIKPGTYFEIKKLPFRSHITGRLITEGTWIIYKGLPVQLQSHEFVLAVFI